MTAIDTRELKLRVQGSFSTGELRAMLERWGADPSRLPEERVALAQELVRLGERTLGAEELVRRLRAEKPLVEWPEITGTDASWAGPAHEDALLDAPADPVIAELAPAAVEPARTDDASSSHAHVGPPPSTRTGDNPFVFKPAGEPTAQPRPGVDPRLLIGVAGLMVVLAGVAFGAGMVWRRAPAPAASAPDAAAVAARGQGPAGRAADTLNRGLLAVAGLCDLGVSGLPTREVLAIAQEGCGNAELERMRRSQRLERELAREPRKSPLDDEELLPEPDLAPDPIPGPRRTDAAPTGGNRCIASCAKAQASCANECGAEPSDATTYDKYLGCTTRCVTQNSRCRLACP